MGRPSINGVASGDPAFLALALRSYMEWAVDDVMAYAPSDATVPAHLPMPRWAWDGLVSS